MRSKKEQLRGYVECWTQHGTCNDVLANTCGLAEQMQCRMHTRNLDTTVDARIVTKKKTAQRTVTWRHVISCCSKRETKGRFHLNKHNTMTNIFASLASGGFVDGARIVLLYCVV